MITKLFSRSALHEHTEPAQRILGAADLSPDSEELARLLADPVPEVRAAAAKRCTDLAVLAAVWETETDAAVRSVVASSLGEVLAETEDGTAARAVLEAAHCTDAIRFAVARRTQDPERRHAAIAVIRDEDPLVELALVAGHAETRIAAAERVQTPEGLRRLHDAAKNKDHGVARLARQRIDAMATRREQEAEADTILSQLEALATRPGPILTAVVELNRRWQALDMSHDAERLARCEAARQTIQARFDREHEEQRARTRFERRLREWLETLEASAEPEAPGTVRAELAALREEAQGYGDAGALASLEQAEARLKSWEEQRQAVADAEALVLEAEQLAAGTSIDNAKLPERWQALDRAIRTPALTRRFEAALIVVEQRRLAQVQAAQQEANALRQRVHALLHNAEQALAAGQLQAVRAAVDEIKGLKAAAGLLPKPTLQRLGRATHQLAELERWESFGQHNARVQLCERAESLAQTTDPVQLAHEVQNLRNEWKALDQQYAGVPKSLWERFDRACEKAYAPAARHFSELAARRKESRKQREEFIAAAEAHAATLAGDTPDWRGVERWLRDTDHAWREGDLGSVEPNAWKKLDQHLKTVLAPLREALSAAREKSKAARRALIEEATALAAKASERDTPSQVKAIQVRWQEQAKSHSLPQRDERALWDEFRTACDAVFNARQSKRKEEDNRRHEGRRALEDTCAQLEQLAKTEDKGDQDIRRELRDLQEQWRAKGGGLAPAIKGGGLAPATRGVGSAAATRGVGSAAATRGVGSAAATRGGTADSALQALDSRFHAAKGAVEVLLSSRARARENAVWRTLAAKERLCEELDQKLLATGDGTKADTRETAETDTRETTEGDTRETAEADRRETTEGDTRETAEADTRETAEADTRETPIDAEWNALPPLPAAWEAKLGTRRSAAQRALADAAAANGHRERIERGTQARSEMLLELEMMLGLDSPKELQAQRLALQVRQLRDRFQGASINTAANAGDRLVAWCAEPGIVDAKDRQRSARVFSAIEKTR